MRNSPPISAQKDDSVNLSYEASKNRIKSPTRTSAYKVFKVAEVQDLKEQVEKLQNESGRFEML